jgi:hypothetical protein
MSCIDASLNIVGGGEEIAKERRVPFRVARESGRKNSSGVVRVEYWIFMRLKDSSAPPALANSKSNAC